MKIKKNQPVIIEINEDGTFTGWCDNAFLFFLGYEEEVKKNNDEYPENNGEELCG